MTAPENVEPATSEARSHSWWRCPRRPDALGARGARIHLERLGKLFLGALLLTSVWACGRDGGSPRLLLLVTVDTLRSDRLGAYGSERGLTPSLDRLASESQVFEKTYAPASFTGPSITTILTGRYPEQNAIFSNSSILPRSVVTLAMVLKEQGYRTGAVVSNFVLRPGTGLERGFDAYDATFSQRELNRDLPERIATETTDDALRMLDQLTSEGEGQVFLWVHYQDPHGPYTPPGEIRELILEREDKRGDTRRVLPLGNDNLGLGSIPSYQHIGSEGHVAYYRAGYDAEVRYADGEIGRFLDGVVARTLYQKSLIIFAADHGESLGENDYWFAHGEYLSEPLVRVPLFIRIPGEPPGHRVDVAMLADILPTLLPLLGISPPYELPGRDLLSEGAEQGASTPYMATLDASTVPRFGLVSGGFKYVVTLRKGRREEQLFRLGDGVNNLEVHEQQQLEDMRRQLRTMRRQFQPKQGERTRRLSRSDRSKLRALGYVDDH